jgi:hypothetical protein
MKTNKNNGGVLMEYLVVTVALIAAMWWAIVGDTGYWGTNDPEDLKGSIMMDPADDPGSRPSLINALNDKQYDFAREVYQP